MSRLHDRLEDASDATMKQKEQHDHIRSQLKVLGSQLSSLLSLGDAIIDQKEQHDRLQSRHYDLHSHVTDTLAQHRELHAQLGIQQEQLGSKLVSVLAATEE